MTIRDIYNKYRILPSLQKHMIRVAAVVKLICDSSQLPIEGEMLIKAALLHDIGNIIKFNLEFYPDFLQPEGIEYWSKIKSEFVGKYGANEHLATAMIAQEIGLPSSVSTLVQKIEFSKMSENLQLQNPSLNILCYADQRVTPNQIVSLEERIREGQIRFLANTHTPENNNKEVLAVNSQAYFALEHDLFRNLTISPEDINNVSIEKIIDSGVLFDIAF